MKLREILTQLESQKKLNAHELLVLEYAMIIDVLEESETRLDEGIMDVIKTKITTGMGQFTTKLKDMGFEFHNTKPGLIQTLATGGLTLAKAFILGLSATNAKARGDSEKLAKITAEATLIKDEVRQMFTKQSVVDFLLQLDTATAHLVTGPIHMFSALTGVHIVLPWESKDAGHGGGHGKKHEPVGITDIIRSSIQSLKDKVMKGFEPEKAQQIQLALDRVNTLIATP